MSLIKPHHFFLCQTQYPSFENSDFGGISLHRNRKIILTFLTFVTEDVITYYIVSFSFPGPQAKFS